MLIETKLGLYHIMVYPHLTFRRHFGVLWMLNDDFSIIIDKHVFDFD